MGNADAIVASDDALFGLPELDRGALGAATRLARLVPQQASGRARALVHAVRYAAGFRRLSGLTWRRMVRDGLALRHDNGLTWSQVLLAANTPMLLRSAMVDGRTDRGVMAAGQVAGVIDDLPSCAELVERIMKEAEDVRERLTGPR